jgi:hypothetical protein
MTPSYPETSGPVPYHDVITRQNTRLCFVYGLLPRIASSGRGQPIGDVFEFGRLHSHVRSNEELLPTVLHAASLAGHDDAPGQPASLLPAMRSLRACLMTTTRGDLVLVLDGELDEPLDSHGMAALLATTCFDRWQLTLAGQPAMTWAAAALAGAGLPGLSPEFGNDVHQCVFPELALAKSLDPQHQPEAAGGLITEIVYRGTMSDESGAAPAGIYLPPILNRPGSTVVAHGRGVSVFTGWATAVENAFVLTAISTVSSLGALRRVRREAFSAMALSDNGAGAARAERSLVMQLSDRLSEMQLDLSFGVETYIDAVLVPEMVVEGFQRSLGDATGMRDGLENTSRMLDRVAAVMSVRLSKLEAAERERVERRDRLVGILVAVATLLALPPTLLLAFFGVNARQVHQANSMFDFHAYWGAYLLAWLPFMALVAAGSLAYARIRDRSRPGRLPPVRRRRRAAAPDQGLDADD